MNTKKMIWIMGIVFMLMPMVAQAGRISGGMSFGFGDAFGADSAYYAPAPTLLEPIRETVDLRGKDTLMFRWNSFVGEVRNRRYYELWIFKGREQFEKDRIYKQRIPATYDSVVLKADMFEDGQVYTWALRQVYYQVKSDWAYSSFKVIKQAP